jgi:nitrogen fixation/metabolism regulation signal transduction histidine kinase
MKVALALAAALGAMLVFLLATASADTSFLAEYTLTLIGMNALAALVLLALVAAQVRRLFREYRNGVFGARLKSRLLLMLAMMAVVPGVLVYAVSMQFAVKSIDSWFDVRVEAALDGGLDLGRGVLDAMQEDLLAKGRVMAYELSDTTLPGPVLLNRLREQAGVEAAYLLNVSGQLLASSHGNLHDLLPVLPEAAQLRQARQGAGSARVESGAADGLTIRALIPVRSYRLGTDPLVLHLEQPVPAAIAESAALVESARRDYQELQLGRAGLKRLYTLTLTFALLLALFAAVALAFFLAARLAQPLLTVVEGTRAVAAGDFTPRAVSGSGHREDGLDELGVLTRSFNDMTVQLDQARREREAAHASMLAAQRAAAWGEVARRLAHEIKNPLTPIQLSAERLQMKLAGKLEGNDAAMLKRATRTIVDQVETMKNMVNDFRDYARLPPPLPVALDLNALVAEVLELYEDGPVPVVAALDPALPRVQADADQMRQVLHNLIKNAAEAMHEKVGCGGTARIEVRTRLLAGQGELAVADCGPGFPPEILANAFEPYVTTKAKGTGLGLAIVKKIVDDHGGAIALANRPDGGAEVSLRLPLHRPPQADATTA